MNDYPVSVIPEGQKLILWKWWVHLAETPPARTGPGKRAFR